MESNLTFSLLLENVGADVRFDYFNSTKKINASSFSFHTHTLYEVYFIENGEMEVCFEEDVLKLKKHDVLVIAPNTVHRVKSCSREFKRFNIRFLLNTDSNSNQIKPYFLYEKPKTIIDEIFSSIDKIYEHMPKINEEWKFFRIKSYFSIIVSYIVESLLPSKNTNVKNSKNYATKNNKIEQRIVIDNFFSDNLLGLVTIEDLAKELNYSKTHVNRLLKSYFNMSFSEKLDQTRLQSAKLYLRESKEPIYKIAERCGYSTLRGFETFFKKYTGILPKEYRKETNK